MKFYEIGIVIAMLVGTLHASMPFSKERRFDLKKNHFGLESLSSLRISSAMNCTTCANYMSCCDSLCCGGGNYCCPNASTCCLGVPSKKIEGICCGANENCCNDDINGGVCCEVEETFCCPRKSFHASRCCPRWTVCCDEGRVGCCDPGFGKPFGEVGYGLFVIPDWEGDAPLYTASLDLTSGAKKQKQTSFNNWGESTRLFEYNPNLNMFHLIETNWTSTPHTATLFSIDAISGSVQKTTISGTLPRNVTITGFKYIATTKMLIVAMYSDWQKRGYEFFRLDPKTAQAVKISQISNIGSTDSYAGWFDAISADGKSLFRLGFQDPVNEINAGFGVTDISLSTATVKWNSNPATSSLISLNIDPRSSAASSPAFLSLSVVGGVSSNTMQLISWNAANSTTATLTSWSNANLPEIWGDVAEYVTPAGQYYALVIHCNFLDDNFNRWVILHYDLDAQTQDYVYISPLLMAKTDSVSGFGVPS